MTEEVKTEERHEKTKYEEILAKIEELQNAKVEDAQHRQEGSGTEEQEEEEDLKQVFRQSLEELKKELLEIEKQREHKVFLEKVFGENPDDKIKELAKDTGLSEDTLVTMASENIEALKKLFPDNSSTFLFSNESNAGSSHQQEDTSKEATELADLFRKTKGFMSPQQYGAVVAKWEVVSEKIGKRDFSPFPEDHNV